MDLTHRFTVPTPIDETWAHFNDIADVAGCFPGAQVTSVEDDTFTGTVKVKLGPIALVYTGTGTFVDKDESAHSFKVDAKGKDKRGNGTAGAKVKLSMESAASGGTDVEVITDLAITGKPAQFGRGVMQDVSDKLLGQFVACLEERLSGSQADLEEDLGPETGEAGPASTSEPTSESGPASEPAPSREPRLAPRPPPSPEPEALDLGSAVLPVLAKAYWREAAGVCAVLVVLGWLARRHR